MADTAAIFDGSFEGFLNIIYSHYYEKLRPSYIFDSENRQQTLDTEQIYISTDYGKSERVLNAITTKMSGEAASNALGAFCSGEENKYMDIYRYIIHGFRVGKDVDRYEQLDFVLRVHKLKKYVYSECHLLKGFSRFSKTNSGVYYCKITPVNNVLALLAEHFTDRLMDQQWVIHDTTRGLAAVYDGNTCEIRQAPIKANIMFAEGEDGFQSLWKTFYETIAVETRKSRKRQRSMLPLRYRGNMTEFIYTEWRSDNDTNNKIEGNIHRG